MARKGTELKLGVETLEARTVLNATVTLGAAGQGVQIAAAVDNGTDKIHVFTVGGKTVITDTGNLTLQNLGAAGNVISHTKHKIVFAKAAAHGDLIVAAGQSDVVTVAKNGAGTKAPIVGGDLTITTAGKADVILNGVAVNGETNANINGVSTKAPDLQVINSHLGLNVTVTATGNNLVVAQGSKFGSDFTYNGAVGNNGGVDRLLTKNNQFTGDVKVNTGAANDQVVVLNSFFLDPVTLNGGTGVNTLTNTGNNFQKTVTVVGF